MEITAQVEGRNRLTFWAWLLLIVGLVAGFGHNFAEMWLRWFPAWRNTSWSLYDRIIEGERYYTHGPLIPFISLIIMVLLIRHTKVPVRPRRLLGATVLLGSLLLHLMACLARVNFVSGFALIGVLAGLILVLWGATALRRLWFPLALLVFMVPLPEVSIGQLNFRLKMFAADWGVRLANLIGVLVERAGNQVFLEGGKSMIIANVCNGLRTLISLIAFGALYAYVCRLRGLWRLGLFAMSIPVAVVSNSVRIVSLIVVADIWDVETATGWYHDMSGLMVFAMAFLLMFGLERLVLWLREALGRPAKITPLFQGVLRNPKDRQQWPRLLHAVGGRAGFSAAILLILAAGGAWWLNRSVPPVWNQQMARQALPADLNIDGRQWNSYDLTLDELTLAILETRDYLFRRYVSHGVTPVDFCIIFSQDNRKGTHPPEVCLEGGGQDIIAKADLVVPGVEGRGDILCRELIVQSGANKLYFLYVYKCGDSYTRSYWVQQYVIFTNGLLYRNASGALIRVSTPVGNDLAAARRRSMKFLGIALPYLDRALP